MDFPQFFRTAVNNFTISSAKWRGLAVLVKPPELKTSSRGFREDDVYPVTGSTFTDRDCPIHIMQKSNLVATITNSTNGAEIVAARPGIRFLIHSVHVGFAATVTDTMIFYGVKGAVKGNTIILGLVNITLTAARGDTAAILDILTDVNTPISVSSIGTLTYGEVDVYYSEVGAS